MLYAITAIVEVSADTRAEAHAAVRHALEHARKADIRIIDTEITSETPEEDA
jgi:hypothetical protein